MKKQFTVPEVPNSKRSTNRTYTHVVIGKKMKTDNSRAFEEKFQEGYNTRTREINLNCLILIENELYEVTSQQRFEFYTMIGKAAFNREEKNNALDYIRKNCKCINCNVRHFNY